ncbi:MAG: SMC-Scp complex subunit ScpB [Pseudomonadota bacterium]
MNLLKRKPVDDIDDNAPDDVRKAVRQLSFAYKRSADTLKASAEPSPLQASQPPSEPVAEPEGMDEARLTDALRRAEAILFAAGEPLSADQIAAVLPPDVEAADVLMELKRTYAGRGVQLVQVGGKWRFQTAQDLAFLFVEERHVQKKLSQAALETLAIIAYSQPVTRGEIEAVRGVAVSKGVIDQLMEAGWVRVKGHRKTPGRPATFGTTPAFLEHFGLETLDMLPGKAELAAEGLLSDAIPNDFAGVPDQSDAGLEDFDSTPDADLESAFVTDFLTGAEETD